MFDAALGTLQRMGCDAKPFRILVADDNEDTADSLATLLTMSGHHVYTVYDGAAAVQMAMAHRPDIGILDIGMPKMNGYEVARAVRQAQLGTFLIAVSGWGTPNDVRRAEQVGFRRHFTKPTSFAAIEQVLRTVAWQAG